uniref:Uncharacterized protein n=1 Tax=Wuchereria bancrofti TaxID=6293 RepID=A0A1I8EYM7_WUCBA
MRLFFVVKAMQMINSFLIISLLGTYRLCGKTSLDRIDLKDSSCFLWRNSGHKLPCQAVSGMTFPVSIVAFDLIYLICTIISVTRSVLPSSKKINFVRCAIHIILWCTASTSTMYLLNTWEHAWKYTDFKAKIPKQFYIATIFSVTNVIVYCVEIFYSKWLYMRIQLFIKPEMEQLCERLRAGEEMDTGAADLKPEEHFLVPIKLLMALNGFYFSNEEQ